MDRDIEKDLVYWQQHSVRMPLLLCGARQVGKTYVVEKFGHMHFEKLISINLELQPEYIRCFDTLEPETILANISLLAHQTIEPGKTLLFLDEIQECPNAIRALRYFKEKLPELHVIGAGSLLEFILNDENFRMPVGRVQSLYLKPLSFKEYLSASARDDLRQLIETAIPTTNIIAPIHQKLLLLIREYMMLGGMPAVIQAYLNVKDMKQCQLLQTAILNTYRSDFGKYASKTQHQYLQRVFEKAPGMVAEHFKYVNVDPDLRSREIKNALEILQRANLIYFVYSSTASGIPLINLVNEKKFKIIFLDIGLMMRTSQLEAKVLFSEDILLINRGALAEQFVGQELLAYASRFDETNVYFWYRDKPSSMAEVDYITTVGSTIIPVEVKAGTTGRLRSLKLLMDEKTLPIGIRISQLPLSFQDKILSLPLYMVGEIERLVSLLN